jgi:hypothetical protein
MKKILDWDVSAGDDQAQATACVMLLSITILGSVLAFVSGGGQAGIDFSCFWGAGSMALDGHAGSAYDWEQPHQQIILRM